MKYQDNYIGNMFADLSSLTPQRTSSYDECLQMPIEHFHRYRITD